MATRIEQEVDLLRPAFPNLDYRKQDQWVLIPAYQLPPGWEPSLVDISILIPAEYPKNPPYGIYVRPELHFKGEGPDRYKYPAPNQPPFGGTWGVFSWAPEGAWAPKAEITHGSNLYNWVQSFRQRFLEGR